MNRYQIGLEHLPAEAKLIDLVPCQRFVELHSQMCATPWDKSRELHISGEVTDDSLSSAFPAKPVPSSALSVDQVICNFDHSPRLIKSEISEQKANITLF